MSIFFSYQNPMWLWLYMTQLGHFLF